MTKGNVSETELNSDGEQSAEEDGEEVMVSGDGGGGEHALQIGSPGLFGRFVYHLN